MLVDTWHLFNKYLRISVRSPMWTLFNLIQPLIWLVIFGQLFNNMAKLPGFPTSTYTDFLLPGVLIMTVLFGSSWSGISLLREINGGIIDKILVAPISRVSIVLSRVIHSAVQVLAQTVIIIFVAFLMGSQINFQLDQLLLALLVIFFLGIGFAAASNGLAIHMQREEPLVVLGNLMTLPLLFFSTAMVPKDYLPAWIDTLSIINPVHYGVEALRAVLVGTPDLSAYTWPCIITGLFAAACLVWAVSAFNSLRD